MKPCICWLLLLSLLLSLTACGGTEAAATSPSPTKSPAELLMEAVDEALGEEMSEVTVDTSISWTELSENDGTWSYMLTGDADLAELDVAKDAPVRYYTRKERVKDTMMLQEFHIDGTTMKEYAIPMEDEEELVWAFCFGEDSVWLLRCHSEFLDTENGTERIISDQMLEHWDSSGNRLLSLPFEDLVGENPDFVLFDMALYGDMLMLMGETSLYWLDENGSIVDKTTLEAGSNYFRYDADGDIYIYDVDTGALRALDCQTHTPGNVLLDTAFLEGVYPGSGPYDFFLCGDTLRGVDLENETITEFLTLSDWGLADMVNNVIYFGEGAFVLGLYSVFSGDSQYQILQRVAPKEIPEKTVITMAYGMGEQLLSDGFTWKNTSNSLDMEIAEFNLRNSQYSIEVVEFADANDLNIQMSAGEIPDIICWSSNLNDAAAIRSYQRNGYLADLLPLMEEDPEVDPGDLLPSIREAYTESDGCIYMLPTDFFCFSLKAHSRFVGTEPGWSFTELYEIAQTLPEETLIYNATGSWFLKQMLEYTLENFVDVETGQCSFDCEEFRALMYTARDHLPRELPYETTPETFYTVEGLTGGELLLQMDAFVGGTQYAAEYMPENEAAGITVIGYPGVRGNGTVMEPGLTFSICAVSDRPEGAWAFLRNYFTYEFQLQTGWFLTFPIMESALMYSAALKRQTSYDCTDAQYEESIQLVLDAVVPELMDDTILNIILEEAEPFLQGEKDFEAVTALMESRISIYLSEQS